MPTSLDMIDPGFFTSTADALARRIRGASMLAPLPVGIQLADVEAHGCDRTLLMEAIHVCVAEKDRWRNCQSSTHHPLWDPSVVPDLHSALISRAEARHQPGPQLDAAVLGFTAYAAIELNFAAGKLPSRQNEPHKAAKMSTALIGWIFRTFLSYRTECTEPLARDGRLAVCSPSPPWNAQRKLLEYLLLTSRGVQFSIR